MKVSRLLPALATLLAVSAASAETIRVGLPTKTYWPTTIAETAIKQKLFEKEGITADDLTTRSKESVHELAEAFAADHRGWQLSAAGLAGRPRHAVEIGAAHAHA
jgi:NitT/TauT family transport system substrate-binding protein